MHAYFRRTGAAWLIVWMFGALLFGWSAHRDARAPNAYLVLVAAAQQPGVLQLYYDDGTGMSEARSIRQPARVGAEPYPYFFRLTSPRIQALRLDPIDAGAMTLDVHRLALFDADGRVLREYPLSALAAAQAVRLEPVGNALRVETAADARDPILLVNGPPVDLTPGRVSFRPALAAVARFTAVLFALALVAAYMRTHPPSPATRSQLYAFAGLTLLGAVVFFLRNPDPVLNPVLYTEDGSWLSMLMLEGWWHTLIHARWQEDYFVWGNILLLGLGLEFNRALFGPDVAYLPQTVAALSYLFFGGLAAFSYVALADRLGRPARLLLYALTLLMPLGGSANEVFGRLSNVGYAFVYLAVLALLWRDRLVTAQPAHSLPVWLLDVLVALCANTNPVCYPLAYAYLAYRVWQGHQSGTLAEVLRRDSLLWVALSVFAAWIAWRYLNIEPGTAMKGEFHPEHLFEAIVARTLLFPYVAPFYLYLGDVVVALLATAWIGILIWAWRVGSGSHSIMVAGGLALAIYTAATLAMRPGLTEWIGSYQTTFPDRYFYGQGLLSILLTVWALDRLTTSKGQWAGRLGWTGFGLLITLYAWAAPLLFEADGPRLTVRTGPSFVEQARLSWAQRLTTAGARGVAPGAVVVVPSYFEGWKINLPAEAAFATAVHATAN